MDDMITHNVGQVHLCIHLQDEATSPQQRERIRFGLEILLKPAFENLLQLQDASKVKGKR